MKSKKSKQVLIISVIVLIGIINISLISALKIISNCTAIQQMNKTLGEDYILDRDIDCDIAPYNTGEGFNPIGNELAPFTGSFDGNSFSISGLFINRGSKDYVGLFGDTNETTLYIRNVSIINVNITGNNYVGGISGHTYCYIEDVFVSGTVIGNGDYVGGIVGKSAGNITNISSTATIYGVDNVGGILGRTFSYVWNSSSNSTVTGNNYVGGLIGTSNGFGGTYLSGVFNSYHTDGLVNGTTSVGGLIGNNGAIGGTVSNSYSTNSKIISTLGGMGCLIGANSGSIITSYSNGTMTGGSDAGGSGGISGYNAGSIMDSFTTCDVSGATGLVGTIVGDSFGTGGYIYNSYYNNISSLSTYDCIGRISGDKNLGCEAIQNNEDYFKGDVYGDYWIGKSPFFYWPFHNIWEEKIDNYPVLTWQGIGAIIYSPLILDFQYPLDNIVYNINITYINHTIAGGYSTPDTCWYTLNEGETNTTTTCSSYPNFTKISGLDSIEGSNTWILYINSSSGGKDDKKVTFFVDTMVYPLINIINITTVTGSQTISFNSTAVDGNLDSCWYSIFDSSGLIDGYNENISFTCNTNTTATVTKFATFNLTMYANDTFGNENSSTQNFKVSAALIELGGVGGGGAGEPEVIIIDPGTFCGDGICQSAEFGFPTGNDLGVQEDWFNCQQDCESFDLDALVFGLSTYCFDDDPSTICYWSQTFFAAIPITGEEIIEVIERPSVAFVILASIPLVIWFFGWRKR